ncbi:coiled-coil domain-containing protein 61 [Cyclospora cayetanensis]|uniref:Coiled-coil domain-containing protein 61 n=1 Tax=Cyclospora cayetanensis TaxID=88456 RepID=A0A6P6S2J4_9EIME|nr:coiled-coil domain-containing protein 61 [Cyclospora cayetanensis]
MGEDGADPLGVGPLTSNQNPEVESLSAQVLLRQAKYCVELSWRTNPQILQSLMTVAVSPVGPPWNGGALSARWEGEYTESFLQQLTLRTGSPLAPRGLWELLSVAVRAAEKDANTQEKAPPFTEHAKAVGAFLNLWSAADLETLKRRAGGLAPSEEASEGVPSDLKLFLIVTKVVDGKKVHYPLALTNKAGAAAVSAAAPTSSLATETPRSNCREATSVAPTQQQQQPTPRALLHVVKHPLEEDALAKPAELPAAAELCRLRALVAEQQAALREAQRQSAACRRELQGTLFRRDCDDPQGLMTQLHTVEAELFMARQRLQTERQLRARETQRFRTEIDKLRRVEASLRTRVRELEARLRAHSCRLRRSLASSETLHPTAPSASSRCSSLDSNAASRCKEARVGLLSGYHPVDGVSRGGPPASVARARVRGSFVGLGESLQGSGTPGARPGGPSRVSASLMASTASSRARQRSDSIGSVCSSSRGTVARIPPCSSHQALASAMPQNAAESPSSCNSHRAPSSTVPEKVAVRNAGCARSPGNCSLREKSPFAAEARCEGEALPPACGILGPENQHPNQQLQAKRCLLQQPQHSSFVVLSAEEYERLRQRGSALTTASSHDTLSAEVSQGPEEPALPPLVHGSRTKSFTAPPLLQGNPECDGLKPTDCGNSQHDRDFQGEVSEQGISNATVEVGGRALKGVAGGRAVFSEIDERLTALQRFLRSTRESFRLMENGLDSGTLEYFLEPG